jgi:HIV Tat-specific factor 1
MFTLEELEEDATLLIDLKEEVREEAEGLGEVTSVTIFDVSPADRSSFLALGL